MQTGSDKSLLVSGLQGQDQVQVVLEGSWGLQMSGKSSVGLGQFQEHSNGNQVCHEPRQTVYGILGGTLHLVKQSVWGTSGPLHQI